MRRATRTLFILLSMLFVQGAVSAQAEDKATPREVIRKVKDAAAFLSNAGYKGVEEFADRNGRWVWKDTYIFVLKCDEMTDAAHPINPKLVGRNLAGIKDVHGNYLFVQLCEASKKPGGGWVEYWWPKVGGKRPSRKITYVLSVPHSSYQVAGGIYDEDIPMDQLNKMIH